MISELKNKIETVKNNCDLFQQESFFNTKNNYDNIILELNILIEQIEILNSIEKDNFLKDIDDEYGLLIQLYIKKAKLIRKKNVNQSRVEAEIEEALESYYKAREHYNKYHNDEPKPWEHNIDELKQLLK